MCINNDCSLLLLLLFHSLISFKFVVDIACIPICCCYCCVLLFPYIVPVVLTRLYFLQFRWVVLRWSGWCLVPVFAVVRCCVIFPRIAYRIFPPYTHAYICTRYHLPSSCVTTFLLASHTLVGFGFTERVFFSPLCMPLRTAYYPAAAFTLTLPGSLPAIPFQL